MFTLYFDGLCPLCIKTVGFIKRWIRPREVNYRDLSTSKIDPELKLRGYNEMLLWKHDGSKYWGYATYVQLLRLSGSPYCIPLILASYIMVLPPISILGAYIYKKVSTNRTRCTTKSCKL